MQNKVATLGSCQTDPTRPSCSLPSFFPQQSPSNSNKEQQPWSQTMRSVQKRRGCLGKPKQISRCQPGGLAAATNITPRLPQLSKQLAAPRITTRPWHADPFEDGGTPGPPTTPSPDSQAMCNCFKGDLAVWTQRAERVIIQLGCSCTLALIVILFSGRQTAPKEKAAAPAAPLDANREREPHLQRGR